jgi:hypothetical protein
MACVIRARADAIAQDDGEPLDLNHRDEIEQLIAAREQPLSEYCFANLYLFRSRHDYRFVRTPLPHIVGRTYDGRRHAMPLAAFDTGAARSLLASVDCLYPIGAAEAAAASYTTATFNPDDSDYLYAPDELATLARAKDKRRQAAHFDAAATPRLLIDDPGFGAAADIVLANWLAGSGKAPTETDHAECAAAIALAEPLRLQSALVVTRDGPVAFLLASHLADGSKAVHFAKGIHAASGCSPWLFSRYAAACDAPRLNFEQDLGSPGFRRAKRALGPIGQLIKYRLT